MITDKQYLAVIIAAYKAPKIDLSDPKLAPIIETIKEWGETLNTSLIKGQNIYLSGSAAKETAIKGASDCDIFISVNIKDTLCDIFNSLYLHMSNCPLTKGETRKQNVSINVKYNGLDIDLVPGRVQSDNDYHSLYVRKENSWKQTNIKTHIDQVKNSSRKSEIILTKIWRTQCKLDFPSFYIEMIVLDLLHGAPIGDLVGNFLKILQFLSSDVFINKTYLDPSNSNNVISDMLNLSEKQKIKAEAEKALTQSTITKIISLPK